MEILEYADLERIASSGVAEEWLFLETHPDYDGFWLVQSLAKDFFFDFSDLIGPYRALAPSDLDSLLSCADEAGYRVGFLDDPEIVMGRYKRLDDPPPFSMHSDLEGTRQGFLPFQLLGFNFLKDLEGGVGLWSTGTGKAHLGSALIQYHRHLGSFDLAFFVVKAHNKINTQRTLLRLTDIHSVVLDGPKKSRQDTLMRLSEATPGTVAITNYEKFRFDHAEIQSLCENKRMLFIWDEMPTKLKSRGTQLYKAIFSCLYRGNAPRKDRLRPATLRQYMLSATPIENSPEDFFNCVRLISPDTYGSVQNFYQEFVSRYSFFDPSKPEAWHNLEKMGLMAASITHQVDKSDPDIALSFPEILEETYVIDWDDKDRKIYEAVLDYAKEDTASILATITIAQMLCDAPEIVKDSGEVRREYLQAYEQYLEGEGNEPDERGSEMARLLLENIDPKILVNDRHTKIDVLRALLQETHPDEKVVVFSAFNNILLPVLEEKLKEWGITYVLYSGSEKQKQEAQDAFVQNEDIRVFLSSDAGSDSIDLNVASVVIHYDLPWKWSTLIQRQNRIHRVISKYRTVRFYRLVMADSIEERKLKLIQKKQGYHDGVFKGALSSQSLSARMSKDDLIYVLRGH